MTAGQDGLADDAAVDAALAVPGWLVLMYSAQWCAPCGTLRSDVQAVLADRRRVRFGVVDLEACPTAGTRALMWAGQRGVPLLGVFRDGKPQAWQLGAVSRPALERWLASHLN